MAYRAAPARVYAQVLPLWFDDRATMMRWLAEPTRPLDDPAGVELCARLIEALHARSGDELDGDASAGLPPEVAEPLDLLHAALWEGLERPKLLAFHAGALGNGRFTRGRGAARREEQRVAVSLDADPVFTGIQLLHEATHAVTDHEVGASRDRDTAVGADGFAEHVRIERAAVERGQELIDRHAPSWRSAYSRWREHHRI